MVRTADPTVTGGMVDGVASRFGDNWNADPLQFTQTAGPGPVGVGVTDLAGDSRGWTGSAVRN